MQNKVFTASLSIRLLVASSMILVGACGGSDSSGPAPSPTPTMSPAPTPSPTPSSPTPSPTPTIPPTEPLPVASVPPFETPAPRVMDPVEVSIEAMTVDLEQNRLCGPREEGFGFTEVSQQIGIGFAHVTTEGPGLSGEFGGVAAGDFDNDGWVDIYAVGGENNPNALFKNDGSGAFENIAAELSVDFIDKQAGPSFADVNGDGWLDLFVGSLARGLPIADFTGGTPRLLINSAGTTFSDVFPTSNLVLPRNSVSSSWSDYDRDGDLDLLTSRWSFDFALSYENLWRNEGDQTFTSVNDIVGIEWSDFEDFTFAGTFSDINDDGWLDLLYVADFLNSRVYINQEQNDQRVFANLTNAVISDTNGMGSAVGDYDNDGDMDWFVSSISHFDERGHPEGNRLYENRGDGYFTDKTDEAGVRQGYWGWGACFADFDNDTHLDIFHVNGFRDQGERFENDPSRLFMSNGDKTFSERSVELGIDDTGQGRGVVCFDFDRDGDIDIYVSNNGQANKFYCNHGAVNNFLNVQLRNSENNGFGIGAKIVLTLDELELTREVRIGDNYSSNNPAEAHFGLGDNVSVTKLTVYWPDGKTSELDNIDVNRHIIIRR